MKYAPPNFTMKNTFAIIGIWLLIGLISSVYLHAKSMRNKEYDENYFKKEGAKASFLFFIAMGPLSVIFIIVLELYIHQTINRILWRLGNIGVKKSKKEVSDR